MAVTWLHISDFHIRAGDPYDRDVVFDALVRSVERFRVDEKRTPDLIFATGDIAYSGQAEEYAIATKFFDQILEAADIARHRLYVVPGNHDVDRKRGIGLSRTLNSRVEADQYFAPGAIKHHKEKLKSFTEWHNTYFSGIRTVPADSTCGPVEIVAAGGHELGILPINTALFCQDDGDHEKLFVGRRCLDVAVKELAALTTSLNIALMHHPVDFLSYHERPQVRAALVDHAHVLLTGHTHEAGIVNVDMWRGGNLYCSAGAAYQTRAWPNTAYYGTFQGDHVTIFPICYSDRPREAWVPDTSLYPHSPYVCSYAVRVGGISRTFRLPGWDRVRTQRSDPEPRQESAVHEGVDGTQSEIRDTNRPKRKLGKKSKN